MDDLRALQPNRWNVGIHYDKGRKDKPENLLSTIYPGMSAMDARLFRKLKKDHLPIDPDRFGLFQAFVSTVKSWRIRPKTKGHYASALRRFVIWADANDRPICRNTIVPLLAEYSGDRFTRVNSVRRIAIAALNLTSDEKKLLFPPPVQPKPLDDWVFILDTTSGSRKLDFMRLVVPGDAALKPCDFAKKRTGLVERIREDRSSRADLMRALSNEFGGWVTAKTLATASLCSTFGNLRKLVVWADGQKMPLGRANVIEVLQSYSQHLSREWRAGKLRAKSVHQLTCIPMRLLAMVLDREPSEIQPRLSLPPLKNSGWTTERPHTEILKEFCVNLHTIVSSLPSPILSAPIRAPIYVDLCSGGEVRTRELPTPYGGYGDQGYDARCANLSLTSLRIWAEMHRFIAVTGCNLSVAQNFSICEWQNPNLQLEKMKVRANKIVTVDAGGKYAHHIKAHIKFLRSALPVALDDKMPLFPGVRLSTGTMGLTAIIANFRAGMNTLRITKLNPTADTVAYRWARANGLELTPRQLRSAKAMWLLRRHGGDSLRVARALNNKPQLVHEHYGGKGNLEQAALEWSGHWASSRSRAALAPGRCTTPGRYKSVSVQADSSSSCNEGACLSCQHYRPEDSIDYVHAILSYRHYLTYRASDNSELAELTEIIDLIVSSYLERNPNNHEIVAQLRHEVPTRPHPRFAAMIRLVELLHVA